MALGAGIVAPTPIYHSEPLKEVSVSDFAVVKVIRISDSLPHGILRQRGIRVKEILPLI